MKAFNDGPDRAGDLDADIARARASRPADLSDVAVIEEMLAKPIGTYDSDSHPGQPYRRNLQSKLDAARAKQRRDDEAAALTPRQIVDSIPRGF